MQSSHIKRSRVGLINIITVSSLLISIFIMFLVQFKVEDLQDKITKTSSEITALDDEIQLLDVEWVYLTRPERLRVLSSAYLKDSGYASASQIKDEGELNDVKTADFHGQIMTVGDLLVGGESVQNEVISGL